MYVTFEMHPEVFWQINITFVILLQHSVVLSAKYQKLLKNNFILFDEQFKSKDMKFTVTSAEEQLLFLI